MVLIYLIWSYCVQRHFEEYFNVTESAPIHASWYFLISTTQHSFRAIAYINSIFVRWVWIFCIVFHQTSERNVAEFGFQTLNPWITKSAPLLLLKHNYSPNFKCSVYMGCQVLGVFFHHLWAGHCKITAIILMHVQPNIKSTKINNLCNIKRFAARFTHASMSEISFVIIFYQPSAAFYNLQNESFRWYI